MNMKILIKTQMYFAMQIVSFCDISFNTRACLGDPFLPKCIFFLSPNRCKKQCFHRNIEIKTGFILLSKKKILKWTTQFSSSNSCEGKDRSLFYLDSHLNKYVLQLQAGMNFNSKYSINNNLVHEQEIFCLYQPK